MLLKAKALGTCLACLSFHLLPLWVVYEHNGGERNLSRRAEPSPWHAGEPHHGLHVKASLLASQQAGFGRIPSLTHNGSLLWQEDRCANKKWVFNAFTIRKGCNDVIRLAFPAVTCNCVQSWAELCCLKLGDEALRGKGARQHRCSCASSCLLLPLLPGHRWAGAATWCRSPGNRAATRLAKILPRRPLDLLLYGSSLARHMQIFNLLFNSALWASEPEAKSYQLAWKRDFPCKQQAQRALGNSNSQLQACLAP